MGSKWDQAYDSAEFAQKYGLTLSQAKTVIRANGPSKKQCDIAAPIFLKAARQFGQRRSERNFPH
ncbi:hypothetical protein [Mesorhizobium sp. B1-1-8]|uniref:hypothetical protein n=1 Tax=Mesorhizobium sp. B1-1-8 TaxID=2589976 RepID=UPI0015E3FA7D|nr:hypothetical protein [Mesorhizobium sp. B1-1-8]UCI10542.1 hypothetical protein FJ974_30050 [Mesorhizobium sp. B1-1-8]